MGAVFKKSVTKPIPDNAEIIKRDGQRLARWKDKNGKTRSAPLIVGKDGTERVRTESAKYVAKYRDAGGIVREVATGCRDKTAAKQFLDKLERESELIKAGSMTQAQATIGRHSATPIQQHFELFIEHLQAKGTGEGHQVDTLRNLRRLADECGFTKLADLRRERLERWLAKETKTGRSARSRNAYQTALTSFVNPGVA